MLAATMAQTVWAWYVIAKTGIPGHPSMSASSNR